jgi:predicted RNase H-like nuclease (RuvC/YqgF family)
MTESTKEINQGADAAQARVAGSYNFAAQLPNGKSLTMSGYIIEGDTLADVNMKLDFTAQAIERQRLKAEVPELEAKLDNLKKTLVQIDTMIEDMKGKERLSAQEKQNINTLTVNRKKVESDIADGMAAVERAKKAAA